jgi:hypothetical protein
MEKISMAPVEGWSFRFGLCGEMDNLKRVHFLKK